MLEVFPPIMKAHEQDSLSCLAERMEQWRRKLHCALDEAGGDQLDPRVQEISAEFDRAMNAYMRKQRDLNRN